MVYTTRVEKRGLFAIALPTLVTISENGVTISDY